ncbi:MAG: AtpZ/AtpI family protein, partial [Acidimicrobiales bacterium]
MADGPTPPGTTGDAASGEPGGRNRAPKLGDLFWIGTACAISVVAAGGIGYAIDDALGTAPWFSLGGLAFGVLSAV